MKGVWSLFKESDGGKTAGKRIVKGDRKGSGRK